jgi:hypothetical protein
MATFRPHVPAFFDISEPPPATEFATTAQLLAIDRVARYRKKRGFSHFAMEDECLLAVLDDGHDWWVIGTVSDPSAVDLPKWGGWKFRAELPDGTQTVLGDEVVSCCGDVLTLRDGTKARDLADS